MKFALRVFLLGCLFSLNAFGEAEFPEILILGTQTTKSGKSYSVARIYPNGFSDSANFYEKPVALNTTRPQFRVYFLEFDDSTKKFKHLQSDQQENPDIRWVRSENEGKAIVKLDGKLYTLFVLHVSVNLKPDSRDFGIVLTNHELPRPFKLGLPDDFPSKASLCDFILQNNKPRRLLPYDASK